MMDTVKPVEGVTPMQLYLDCDGVLADFDSYFAEKFGHPPRAYEEHHGSKTFWEDIQNASPGFYRNLPLMPDAYKLYEAVRHLRPIILTGCPMGGWAEAQKLAWAAEHFPGVPMITCSSKLKRTYCQPGDILIDDWPKYRDLWEEADGTFILHTSADASIAALDAELQARRRSAPSEAVPGWVLVPESAIGWLYGETPDANGQWFHEVEGEAPAIRRYWWRSHFRKLIASPPAPSVPVTMLISRERLREKIEADPDDAEVEVRPAPSVQPGESGGLEPAYKRALKAFSLRPDHPVSARDEHYLRAAVEAALDPSFDPFPNAPGLFAALPVAPAGDVGGEREALIEAEELLQLIEDPALPDPAHHEEVKTLGRRIGFGALMSTASAGWREWLEEKGYPTGGEFVAGPCFVSVQRTLGIVRTALRRAPSSPAVGWGEAVETALDAALAAKVGGHSKIGDWLAWDRGALTWVGLPQGSTPDAVARAVLRPVVTAAIRALAPEENRNAG